MLKGYDAIDCYDCGTHVCYMVYCGPHGSILCDRCMEKRIVEEEETENDEETRD